MKGTLLAIPLKAWKRKRFLQRRPVDYFWRIDLNVFVVFSIAVPWPDHRPRPGLGRTRMGRWGTRSQVGEGRFQKSKQLPTTAVKTHQCHHNHHHPTRRPRNQCNLVVSPSFVTSRGIFVDLSVEHQLIWPFWNFERLFSNHMFWRVSEQRYFKLTVNCIFESDH